MLVRRNQPSLIGVLAATPAATRQHITSIRTAVTAPRLACGSSPGRGTFGQEESKIIWSTSWDPPRISSTQTPRCGNFSHASRYRASDSKNFSPRRPSAPERNRETMVSRKGAKDRKGKRILRGGRSFLFCHAERSEASALRFSRFFRPGQKNQKQILRR